MQKVSFYIWMCAIFLISFDVKSQNILDDNIKVTAKENNGKCVISPVWWRPPGNEVSVLKGLGRYRFVVNFELHLRYTE